MEKVTKIIKVAAGIIVCKGHILIAQRKHGKDLEYKWEFPGGKLEQGETYEQCLARELLEEMNLPIVVGDHFMDTAYDYDFGRVELHCYKAVCAQEQISELNEHEQYRWVPAGELVQYDFAPADKPIIAALLETGKSDI